MRCALSCGLFRTFACGSFRSWTFSPLPQSVPRKNPNYLRNTSAQDARCLAWIFVPLLRTLIRSRMPDPLPHHRLAKTQISGAILPRMAANERSEGGVRFLYTDLYGFVRIRTEGVIIRIAVCFSVPIRTHLYPSVPHTKSPGVVSDLSDANEA